MELAFAPYTLQPRTKTQAPREGALLRFRFATDLVGYADCHPWSSLGDLPLSQQLQLLKNGAYTPLTLQSHFFAKRDAVARKEGRSLYAGLTLPKNHYFIPDLLSYSPEELAGQIQEGFTHFKVKLGKALESEEPQLKKLIEFAEQQSPKILFSLDFNSQLGEAAYRELLPRLLTYRHSLDYIEDPFPYCAKTWETYHTQIPLVVDRNSLQALGKTSFPLIIKPAVQKVPSLSQQTHHNVIFTSYLDHPLGQLTAAVEAAEFYRRESIVSAMCGLHTAHVYEATSFSEQIQTRSPFLNVPVGTGYGFNALLEKTLWRPL